MLAHDEVVGVGWVPTLDLNMADHSRPLFHLYKETDFEGSTDFVQGMAAIAGSQVHRDLGIGRLLSWLLRLCSWASRSRGSLQERERVHGT